MRTGFRRVLILSAPQFWGTVEVAPGIHSHQQEVLVSSAGVSITRPTVLIHSNDINTPQGFKPLSWILTEK
jgi:hypothetical protein